MLKQIIAALWHRAPKWVRRWSVLLSESRFTVTTAAVITDTRGRILLLRHYFRPGSGWGVPGGFILPREQPEDAIRRELREEIGLEISSARVVYVRTLSRYQQVEIIFLCQPGLEISSARVVYVRTISRYQQVEIIFLCQPAGECSPKGFEIKSAEWFAPDSLPEALSRDQREIIQRALQWRGR